MTRPKLGILLRWLLAILLLGLVVRVILTHLPDLDRQSLQIDWPWLLFSIMLLGLHYQLQAFTWQLLTKSLEMATPLADTFVSWNYSLLGKYTPGKVGVFFSRIYFYKRAGKSMERVTMAVSIEIVLQALAASLVAALALSGAAEGLVAQYRVWLWLLAVVLALLSNPKMVQFAFNCLMRLLKKKPAIIPLNWYWFLKVLFCYMASCILLGLAFFAFVCSLYPVDANQFLYLTGAFLLAGLAGMLSVVAPAGMGVRDGVLLLALLPLMPEALAATISLAARAWTTTVELLCVLFYFIIHGVLKRRGRVDSSNKSITNTGHGS